MGTLDLNVETSDTIGKIATGRFVLAGSNAAVERRVVVICCAIIPERAYQRV